MILYGRFRKKGCFDYGQQKDSYCLVKTWKPLTLLAYTPKKIKIQVNGGFMFMAKPFATFAFLIGKPIF